MNMFTSFARRLRQCDIKRSILFASTVPVAASFTFSQYHDSNALAESNSKSKDMNTLIVGSGEYVTGYTGKEAVKSDKSMGVVGIVFFDLRRRGLVGPDIAICGTNGDKFKGIRKHWDATAKQIFHGSFGSPEAMEFTAFPSPGVRDYEAYKQALSEFSKPGDLCIIFTPDDTHFAIAEAAIDHGLHVMATKPFVKTLEEHLYLNRKAKEKGVLLQIEVHKRFDAMYNDAVNRMQSPDVGDFNYFVSYMSQPKFQLNTFKSWAGISSDISYYLNSHHIDLHVWAMQNKAKCIGVTAFASNGVAASKILDRDCEDTITVNALWENTESGAIGHAVYTSSWTAIKADVHSQQRFFCLMENAEINIDQAHRGYTLATDEQDGVQHFGNINPLYHRNMPDAEGNYCAQNCYGYITFEEFVKAAKQVNEGKKKPEDFDSCLPTGNVTAMMTAILEAGRISLDNKSKHVHIEYDDNGSLKGLRLAD